MQIATHTHEAHQSRDGGRGAHLRWRRCTREVDKRRRAENRSCARAAPLSAAAASRVHAAEHKPHVLSKRSLWSVGVFASLAAPARRFLFTKTRTRVRACCAHATRPPRSVYTASTSS